MNKVILGIFVFVLMSSFVMAQGEGIHEAGTGIDNSEVKAAGHGTGQGLEDGQARMAVQSGSYLGANGQKLSIQRQANNQYRFEVGGVAADCPFNLTQEQMQNQTRLYARLSNGQDSEIVVMPDAASQTALQRLRLQTCDENCTMQMVETREQAQTRLAYELSSQRNAKVFGLFQARMNVQAQVDAENGEVLQTNKPWWAFLATEPEE